jgi:hypothetical protein
MRTSNLILVAIFVCFFGHVTQGTKPVPQIQNQQININSAPEKAGIKNAIANRSPLTTADMIDLTGFYTRSLNDDLLGKPGTNLSSIPQGMQIFAQSAFDVRGIIQLAGKTETGNSIPKEVKGIVIKNSGNSLCFLQGSVGTVNEDTKIGEYVLHYVNGKTASIPIIYQRNVSDWFYNDGDKIPTNALIAWTAENEASKKSGSKIQLYKYTVNNPFPNTEIETIDFISTMTESAPFLIAISMDKNFPGENKPFRYVKIENNLPKRSPDATPDQIDLSNYFNTSPDDDWVYRAGHDFQSIPRGLVTLGGSKFDLRGMIVLASSFSIVATRVLFPETVKGINVQRKGKKIEFLQGCEHGAKPGTQVAQYVIHYADGQTRNIPLLFMKNTFDWWCKPEVPLAAEPNVEEVWRGQNPASRSAGALIHLVKYTWENPLPDVEISSIDFDSDLLTVIPFLFAITVE